MKVERIRAGFYPPVTFYHELGNIQRFESTSDKRKFN